MRPREQLKIREWRKEEGTKRGEVGFMERANEAKKLAT
jgi:hypothetical protein